MSGPIASGSIENAVREIIKENLAPMHIDLVNESDMHSGPPGRESHFKLLVVSDKFVGVGRVHRQREVYKALGDLMSQIHALSLYTYTPEEWQTQKPDPQSPLCSSKG